jgi:membrane protein DedA with SNARE-associated domain
MPLGRFLAYSALGSVIWCGGLAVAGYLLEDRYDAVSHLINPLSTAVVVAIVGVYLWRVIRWRPRD